jgi:hypothetical protein
MIARALQFAGKHYLAWSAFKLGAFIGWLGGLIHMAVLLIPAIVGRD